MTKKARRDRRKSRLSELLETLKKVERELDMMTTDEGFGLSVIAAREHAWRAALAVNEAIDESRLMSRD